MEKQKKFSSFVGVDDEVPNNQGSVQFKIYGDQKLLWDSAVMKGADPAKEADVNIKGVKKLLLVVGSAEGDMNNDHADWADAKIIYSGQKPLAEEVLTSQPSILTQKPAATPKINGQRSSASARLAVFIHNPSNWKAAYRFSVEGLPAGLSVDKQKGIITGKLEKTGDYKVVFTARTNLEPTNADLK